MPKKINGAAKWIIVAIAICGLAFNSGILYNDVSHLKAAVDELKTSYKSLDEKLDTVIITLSAGANDDS